MHSKKLVVISGALVLGVVGLLIVLLLSLAHREESVVSPVPRAVDRIIPDSTEGDPAAVVVASDTFSGRLEAVRTDCFADGECSVVVDGRQVTVLLGFNTETVGSIRGVPSIGDLENVIGQTVLVHAGRKSDGTYTLYGDAGYYVMTESEATVPGAPGAGEAPVVPTEPVPQPPIVSGGCQVGGCSGQICGEASQVADLVTTCEFRAEYACYQGARCERQADGACGWTQTSELRQCLQFPPALDGLEVM
jgi:hypothetical protein